MASPSNESGVDLGAGTSRHLSPPPTGFRHRPLGRATTFAEPSMSLNRRRSSIFSESLSDARRSLKSSTDDLLLPRLSTSDQHEADGTSHWHSLPLGLALLPAVGGMVFKNGSAIITDITLLAIAAIFMNWSLRVPWDWYRTAQSLSVEQPRSPPTFSPIEEEDENQVTEESPGLAPTKEREESQTPDAAAAQQQLRLYEVLALLLCFIAPLLAAWLLHAIRAQLSRPSEGLVSDYNLSIFLLVAEVRPMSHMIKMIQRRTLFLQRRANAESLQTHVRPEGLNVDFVTRIEELEAHVAGRIEASETNPGNSSEAIITRASAQASSDIRRSVQPELDALGRAMRRYEKRTTISAVQFESRLQELEASLKDVVVLAAAAQRTVEQQPKNYIRILANWICGLVVVPIQALQTVLAVPPKLFAKSLATLAKHLPGMSKPKKSREAKPARRAVKSSSQEREKRPKGPV